MLLPSILAVGNAGDFPAHHALAVAMELCDGCFKARHTVLVDQLLHAADSAPACRRLTLEIAQDVVGRAHVAGDYFEQGVVGASLLVKLDAGQAQAFFVNLRTYGALTAREASADVRMMRDQGRKTDQRVAPENRRQQHDVGQMRSEER